MRMSPASFGSLMAFTVSRKNKPEMDVARMVKASFENKEELREYELEERVYDGGVINGKVFNATKDFATDLDDKYREELPKGSKKVIATVADFDIGIGTPQKRYFLTAATDEDESKIHKSITQGRAYYLAKFGYKL